MRPLPRAVLLCMQHRSMPGVRQVLDSPRTGWDGTWCGKMPPPATYPPPPPAHCPGPLRPAASLFCPREDGAEGEGAGTPARPPPLPWSRRQHHGLALLRWWYGQAAQVFPAPHQRRGGASTTCALAPLEGLCPGVQRLQDLLTGAWNGWWHTHHQRVDGPVWLSAVHGPEFGTKGATVGQALQWR